MFAYKGRWVKTVNYVTLANFCLKISLANCKTTTHLKGDTYCEEHINMAGWHMPEKTCRTSFICCGTCDRRYCCDMQWLVLDQSMCDDQPDRRRSTTTSKPEPSRSTYSEWYLWLLIAIILICLGVIVVCKLKRGTSRHSWSSLRHNRPMRSGKSSN